MKQGKVILWFAIILWDNIGGDMKMIQIMIWGQKVTNDNKSIQLYVKLTHIVSLRTDQCDPE